MIEIKDISFAYGKRDIVRNIGLDIEPGECVGILGNNGVGKSTFITCLNKIRTPLSGEVRINKKNVLEMSRNELARSIAYVAQKNEMNQFTVFDSVLLGRKPYIKWSISQEDIAICEEMIQQVGLEDFKLRPIDELSGGEVQKVMLARALVQQPKLLLLDEPTSSLDPRNQYEMLALVQKIAREKGIAVLIVIHDLNLALRYCDKFLFIKEGRVYSYGDAESVNEQALYDVYGIQATIGMINERKFVMID